MLKKSFFILGMVWLCFSSQVSFAANVEPYLQTLLNQGSSTEFYSIILDLKEQVDISKLKADFKATKADYALRHKVVIETLKEKAKTSQAELLNYLQAQKSYPESPPF